MHYHQYVRQLCLLSGVALVLFAADTALPPLNWTAAQDHQNMMDQLGIKALRPGPSGQTAPGTPNMANYDPDKANPYPDVPDALTLKNGKKVTSAEMWWKQRRPEIVEEFDREVYGRVPKNVPKVTWEVKLTTEATVGGIPVIGKQLVGHVDNSSYPGISVDIAMNLVLPKDARKPVPVLMMFGGGLLPGAPAPAGGRGGFAGFRASPVAAVLPAVQVAARLLRLQALRVHLPRSSSLRMAGVTLRSIPPAFRLIMARG